MEISDKIKKRFNGRIFDWQENSNRRAYFSVKKEDIFEVAGYMFKDLGLRFSTASCTDLREGLEILYHFSNDPKGEFYSIRVMIEDKKNPQIDSLAPIFPGAEWIEREIWEMLGVKFINHPNLKRLLLADDWPQGEYPLRKKEN
ncbi:MAG: NADH-quinone oxidoreductase subunit C [Candidatus Omnitrophica bacterium]|nr:NADH-quinone oxidoreductase subunit C [Candidatus Omnitrophota bacterium]MDD5512277.1 NADH-quinone oxidoreductase subunit C [Candidatus Omnitrophota bacterium]